MSQSTYIYRVQSSVWRLPNIDPPPPLHPASVSSPRTKGGGEGGYGTHSPGGEGVGVNISEDARHWIGLLQYNPSTVYVNQSLQSAKETRTIYEYLSDFFGHEHLAAFLLWNPAVSVPKFTAILR
jgi:hypothetical protein